MKDKDDHRKAMAYTIALAIGAAILYAFYAVGRLIHWLAHQV